MPKKKSQQPTVDKAVKKPVKKVSKKKPAPKKKATAKKKRPSRAVIAKKGMMTLQEYAKHAKHTHQYIYKIKRKGIITADKDNQVIAKVADKQRADNAHAARAAFTKAAKEEKVKGKKKDKEFKEIRAFVKKALKEKDYAAEADITEAYVHSLEDNYQIAIGYVQSLLSVIDEMMSCFGTVADSQKKQAHFKAGILEFDYNERAKILVNRNDITKAVYDEYKKRDFGIKSKIESIPSRITTSVRCCRPDAEVLEVVTKIIREILVEIVEAKYDIKPKKAD